MPAMLRWLLTLGPLNPIAVRLVQNGSRRVKHLYVRAVYLAVLMIVLLWSLLLNTGAGDLGYRELAAAGAQSFIWIAYLQIGLICVLSPVFMAGAIAQEANPRTWDILLTTPLGRLQIVLGNLLGRLFFVLALLFASLPLFALTQYFGGVPGTAIFASYLIAACAALAVGAIAISLSVSRLVGRRAVFTFYVAVVTYLGATAAADYWVGAGARVTAFTGLNPFLALRTLLNPSTYPRAEAGTTSGPATLFLEHPVTAWCLLSALVSVVLIGLSAATVRSGGIRELASGSSGIPWHRRMMGLGAARSEHRPPRTVWMNPIAWREASARNVTLGRIVARWTFVGAGGLLALAVLWLYHAGSLDAESFRFVLQSMVGTEIAVITLIAINMAATAVSREREDGTLDLLLTTPITPTSYLHGKLRGLIAYLLPLLAVPVFTVGIAGLYALSGGLGREDGAVVQSGAGGATLEVPVVLPESGLLLALGLVTFTAFCVMVGLYWSLKSRGTIGSVVGAVGVVGVVGGTIGLCGWNAGAEIALVGPALGALGPASLLHACVHPFEAMRETATTMTMASARLSLAMGTLGGAAAYGVIVQGLRVAMVRNFDFTVRRLAGTR